MDLFKQMGKNWTKNTKSKALGETGKKAAYTLLGGLLYTVIPTAIQGWGGINMGGMKGVLAGAAGGGIIGILSDKKEIVGGALATAGIHLTYNHLNGVITGVFGTPIFAYSDGALVHQDEKVTASATVNDGLPEGYGYNSRGELVALNTENTNKEWETSQPTQVSEYTSQLSEYTTDLRDYTGTVSIDPEFMGNFLGNDLAKFGLI